MTEFSIYQINTDRDNNRVCFLGLDSLERFQHSKEVDPALYDRVYDGKLDCNSLETIYEKFNIDHPADYKGRSLSVSDVVEIRESDTLNPGFYFVDSIGFKSISFDKSLCKQPVKASDGKISVLLVEPNKYPKMIEIDDTLEAMQAVVGGDIEEYMPFEDEVAIICNEEGKVNGLTPNRAVYGEPQAVEMTFAEMRVVAFVKRKMRAKNTFPAISFSRRTALTSHTMRGQEPMASAPTTRRFRLEWVAIPSSGRALTELTRASDWTVICLARTLGKLKSAI